MTNEEKAFYVGKRAIAVYPMSNWEGINIIDIVSGINTHVIYQWADDLHKAKVFYDENMQPKFRLQGLGITVNLNECLRYA